MTDKNFPRTLSANNFCATGWGEEVRKNNGNLLDAPLIDKEYHSGLIALVTQKQENGSAKMAS